MRQSAGKRIRRLPHDAIRALCGSLFFCMSMQHPSGAGRDMCPGRGAWQEEEKAEKGMAPHSLASKRPCLQSVFLAAAGSCQNQPAVLMPALVQAMARAVKNGRKKIFLKVLAFILISRIVK